MRGSESFVIDVGQLLERVESAAPIDAVEAVVAYASAHPEVLEVEVNPLLVLTDGAVAADALVRLARPQSALAGAR